MGHGEEVVAGGDAGAARVDHLPGRAIAEEHAELPVQLRGEFEAILGAQPATNAVHQCGSGVTACHNLLAMAHAGLAGSLLYPGSWSEWSSDPQRPVAKG